MTPRILRALRTKESEATRTRDVHRRRESQATVQTCYGLGTHMRTRLLGETGIAATELGLGTWGLSGDGYGPVAEAEQDRVIERALALGIRLFETADSYAHGGMEERLGRLLPREPSVAVVTKLGTCRESVPPRKRFDAEYLERALERSLGRLRRDKIDVVLLHSPSLEAVQRGAAIDFLVRAACDGRIGAWGVAAGTEEVGRAALERGAQVLSIAHNAFHPMELEALRPQLEERSVGILAHSVLAYGLLCGLWSPDKLFPEGDHRAERWTRDDLRLRIRQLDALRPVVRGPVATMRSGALRYVLNEELVSCVLLGPRSTLQLDQLVREAGKGPPYLSPDQLTALYARLHEVLAN